jgi:hypothetical protein
MQFFDGCREACVGVISVAFIAAWMTQPAMAAPDAQAQSAAQDRSLVRRLAAHDRALAGQTRRHAGGGEWLDLDGNRHMDSVLAGTMVGALQQALSNRTQTAAQITDAWIAVNLNKPKAMLVCGGYRTLDHQRHLFIGYFSGDGADATASASETEAYIFNSGDCRLPRPLMITGTGRPVMELERTEDALRGR